MERNIAVAALFALFLAARAGAQSPQLYAPFASTAPVNGLTTIPIGASPATIVTSVKSTTTFQGIAISSFTPTAVVLDTTQMWRWVEVENLDTGGQLICGENPATISTVTNSISGFAIASASATTSLPSKKFDLPAGFLFYCQTTHAGAPSRATVSWGR